MIKFTENDNNKQFIAIELKDNTAAEIIIENLKNTYESLQQANIICDTSEIIIEIDNSINYGFSLNELREHIKTVAGVTVTHFCVDTDEPTQRYYG